MKVVMSTVRAPAVAGMFYPVDAIVLSQDIRQYLTDAHAFELNAKALIVPHAGYMYSGPIAASAYATLLPNAAHINRVVLLGPTHRVAVQGLALPGVDAFATPLGQVMLDTEAIHAIEHLPQVIVHPQTHAMEHSLETQLPFLQTILNDFTLLPLAVGMASAEQVAEVLEAVWGGDETLIIISSDLSHFLPYATAQRVDQETTQAILQLQQPIPHDRACGGTPVSGLIVAVAKHHLKPHLLDLRNSGDTAGAHDQVVGYAAFAFTKDDIKKSGIETNDAEAIPDGQVLLQIARASIASKFGEQPQQPAATEWLNRPGATFVTLTLNGQLRGCIGSLTAHRPLIEDVRNNAIAAAFQDPRFSPLDAEEFTYVKIEVSLLSPAQAMQFSSEADALAQLNPHIDGIIFECNHHRSTFLPQVWEQLPQPEIFMTHLKNKAGLPSDFWSEDIKLSRYTVSKWREEDQHG